MSTLDSTRAASQEPAPHWLGAGPARVPVRSPTAAAAHPGDQQTVYDPIGWRDLPQEEE